MASARALVLLGVTTVAGKAGLSGGNLAATGTRSLAGASAAVATSVFAGGAALGSRDFDVFPVAFAAGTGAAALGSSGVAVVVRFREAALAFGATLGLAAERVLGFVAGLRGVGRSAGASGSVGGGGAIRFVTLWRLMVAGSSVCTGATAAFVPAVVLVLTLTAVGGGGGALVEAVERVRRTFFVLVAEASGFCDFIGPEQVGLKMPCLNEVKGSGQARRNGKDRRVLAAKLDAADVPT